MFNRATICAAVAIAMAGAQSDDTVVETTPAPATPAPASAPSRHLHAGSVSEIKPNAGARRSGRRLPKQALEELAKADPIVPPDEDKHVVSQSRMFSVSGGDALRMGAIATKADEIRGAVCRLMGIDTDWKYAVSIRLIGKSTDPAEPHPIRTRIRIIGQEPNFQIRIYPGGGIDVERLTNAIITMTLFERALSNQRIDALPDSVNVPQWLITGVQQAVLWRSGKGDRRLYRSLFERGEMLSPEEIIATERPDKLDAASRQVYEVSCGVLIMALVHREGGPAQLRELITESAMAEGSPTDIITAHFHELGVNSGLLHKWWVLELAHLSEAPATEMLTPMESENQLVEALTILWYDPETLTPHPVSADNAFALTEVPEWKTKIRPCVDRLMELNLRCFPGYRAIILEYCRALNELMSGTTPDKVQEILLPLRELREAYVKTSLRARDYLDWYEITHLGENSHRAGFTTYLETMQILRREKPGPDTHISRYLEDIETLFGLKSGEDLPEHLRKQAREARKLKQEKGEQP
ncbi:MAG: hypothetical protein Q4F38_09485 [Akkermansia sp.]|nr:hypothetical protein [Akkermansia sp.]